MTMWAWPLTYWPGNGTQHIIMGCICATHDPWNRQRATELGYRADTACGTDGQTECNQYNTTTLLHNKCTSKRSCYIIMKSWSWRHHSMDTFPHNWPFVREIHRLPMESPQKCLVMCHFEAVDQTWVASYLRSLDAHVTSLKWIVIIFFCAASLRVIGWPLDTSSIMGSPLQPQMSLSQEGNPRLVRINSLCSESRLNIKIAGPHIEGILPKGPYLPCVSMAGRALLAGYHWHIGIFIIQIRWPHNHLIFMYDGNSFSGKTALLHSNICLVQWDIKFR